MNCVSWVVLTCTLAALAGCRPDADSPPAQGVGTPITFATPTDPNHRAFIYGVRLRVSVIEVPVGTASDSEQLWSYLDEERTRSLRWTSLGRNGLRVGVTGDDSWEQVVKVLQKLTGRKMKEQLVLAQAGVPLPIELKTNQPASTVFTGFHDGTLSGSDYPAGDYLLTVTCTLDENDPNNFIVSALPQIRPTHRTARYVPTDEGISMVLQPAMFSFQPAMFQLRMTGREVLIIGPGSDARRPSSIAHHFLMHDKDQVEFESVLVLVPELIKAELTDVALPRGT